MMYYRCGDEAGAHSGRPTVRNQTKRQRVAYARDNARWHYEKALLWVGGRSRSDAQCAPEIQCCQTNGSERVAWNMRRVRCWWRCSVRQVEPKRRWVNRRMKVCKRKIAKRRPHAHNANAVMSRASGARKHALNASAGTRATVVALRLLSRKHSTNVTYKYAVKPR